MSVQQLQNFRGALSSWSSQRSLALAANLKCQASSGMAFAFVVGQARPLKHQPLSPERGCSPQGKSGSGIDNPRCSVGLLDIDLGWSLEKNSLGRPCIVQTRCPHHQLQLLLAPSLTLCPFAATTVLLSVPISRSEIGTQLAVSGPCRRKVSCIQCSRSTWACIRASG